MSWRVEARCVESDPALFFPEVGEMKSTVIRAQTELAKQVCGRCLVRSECLEDALARPISYDEWGIRGGLTADERRSLRAHRRYVARRSA